MSTYDLVLVGSSFSSMFFLLEFLERHPQSKRVLVLERGRRREHDWQLKHRSAMEREAAESYVNKTPTKHWRFLFGVGGSSNCWWACTPRMLPNDFQVETLYGVGEDWPLKYDDLEEHYVAAERVMNISGPAESPFPRSAPYPLPPHRLSVPDEILKKAFPDEFFPQPTARAPVPLGSRPMCCNNGVCHLCPVDAKFTILNGMRELLSDSRVEVRTGCRVNKLDTTGALVTGVVFEDPAGNTRKVNADAVALGANGLFNPTILLRSGISDGPVGEGLVEQASVDVLVHLDGVDNFQGTTSITGHGYMLYDGAHRAERAAALVETWNVPILRNEEGRWRQSLKLKFVFDNFREPQNRVTLGADGRPVVSYHNHSALTEKSIAGLAETLPKVLDPLPVQRVFIGQTNPTDAHIGGTTVMGSDPATSVVDHHLRHHRLRNLWVLGHGVFPTMSPANPTLTIAALSMWAARHA